MDQEATSQISYMPASDGEHDGPDGPPNTLQLPVIICGKFFAAQKKICYSAQSRLLLYSLPSLFTPLSLHFPASPLSEKHNLSLNELALMNSHIVHCQSKSNAISSLCRLNGEPSSLYIPHA